MPADPLVENEQVVAALAEALRSGRAGLSTVPALVKRVIEDRCWAERSVGVDRRRVAYRDFVRFVTDPPLEGLGSTVEMLERLCADDVDAVRLLTTAKASRQGERNDIHHNIMEVSPTKQGTSAGYALRVLAENHPSLYEEVKAGRMSPHAAALKAGIRKKTATVEASPDGVARWVRRHFTPEQIDALIEALEGEA